jgi:hypothetical protein
MRCVEKLQEVSNEREKQAKAGNYPFRRIEEYISLVLVEGSRPKAF